jgi:hypothetical protein
VDNLDLNLVDFDSDYLVVVVDYNNHNLIDLVDKRVDFSVEVVVDIEEQRHYFFVMMPAVVVVVVALALVHFSLLHPHSILPKKTTFNKKIKQIGDTHPKWFNIIKTNNFLRIITFKHNCTFLSIIHNIHYNSRIILK